MDDELDAMTRIDLPAYLAREGFAVDRAESTQHSLKLRNGAEVLILRRKPDGVWQYFSATDDHDHGTIVEYVQRRTRLNLGQVRKHLRPYLAGWSPALPRAARPAAPVLPLLDLAEMRRRWAAASPVNGAHPYLAARGLDAATIARFGDVIRIDRFGNALFAHTDDAGALTGYEIKGAHCGGFAKGGRRSLARFGSAEPMAQLAICESGIDALSLAQLVGDRPGLLIVSTGGTVSPVTADLVAALADRNPAAEILFGFDADPPGARMAARLRERLAGRDHVRTITPSTGKDWNDVVRQRAMAAGCVPDALRLGG